MFDQKKESINVQNSVPNGKDSIESVDDNNVLIHTMQDDMNALSGIFPKNNTSVFSDKDKPKAIPKTEEKIKDSQYFNPFLEKQTPQAENKIADFLSKNVTPAPAPTPTPTPTPPVSHPVAVSNIPGNGVIKNTPSPLSEIPSSKPSSKSKKIIWTLAVVFVIIIFFLGGYYFWTTKMVSNNNIAESNVPQESETEENDDTVKIEPVQKYSTDKPNYLRIDTENPSYDNFKSVVNETFLGIKNDGISKPVEFVVTNSKNDSVDFSVFSVISKIKLSEGLLKTLGGNFSLFIYNDAGSTSLGLAVDVSDKIKAVSLIRSEEPSLVAELNSLFVENVVVPKGKISFSDNSYKGVGIRYFNLGGGQKAAIDYAFVENKLVIGTSRESMWLIVDKISSENEED